jgi:hypothetical protein
LLSKLWSSLEHRKVARSFNCIIFISHKTWEGVASPISPYSPSTFMNKFDRWCIMSTPPPKNCCP